MNKDKGSAPATQTVPEEKRPKLYVVTYDRFESAPDRHTAWKQAKAWAEKFHLSILKVSSDTQSDPQNTAYCPDHGWHDLGDKCDTERATPAPPTASELKWHEEAQAYVCPNCQTPNLDDVEDVFHCRACGVVIHKEPVEKPWEAYCIRHPDVLIGRKKKVAVSDTPGGNAGGDTATEEEWEQWPCEVCNLEANGRTVCKQHGLVQPCPKCEEADEDRAERDADAERERIEETKSIMQPGEDY